MSAVSYNRDGEVAVLTVEFPPVNAFGHAVREGLVAGLVAATQDPRVKAVVLIGGGSGFVTGADIREFGKAPQSPTFLEAQAALDACVKPTVAAIHGTALGGGLELALTCHWRVASAGAHVGLPEVKLGLLPGAGGTQRLTRLVGPELALEIMISGRQMGAKEAFSLGLVDELVEGDLLTRAVAFARNVVTERRSLRKVAELGDRVIGIDPKILTDIRKKNERKWNGFLAQWKIVDCVEAACTMPIAEGLKLEQAAFQQCLASPQHEAQLHIFFAEREATKVAGVGKDVRPQAVRTVAVIGSGTMGGGISMSLANAGISVILNDVSEEALSRGHDIITKNYATSVARGSTTQDAMGKALGLIRGSTRIEDIAEADLVIEAVFEQMEVKRDVFRKLDRFAKPDAILATNTSTLDIDKIAAVTRRPERVIGMHFFSPANIMRLLENVRGAKTAPEVIATAMGLAKRIGKVAVLAGNCDGFIGNRILANYGREADFLLEEGATPWQVDRVLKSFGFPMGLYAMRDMSGLDIGWRVRQYHEQFRNKSERYSPIADRICGMGRFGQKTGMGYYRYEGRDPIPDPAIEKLIEDTSLELGIERKPISEDEVLWRILCAMVNEGAKILDEGVAQRASDIDLTYVYGYGFPIYRGGPMFWARKVGLDTVYERILQYERVYGRHWKPATLLERLAKSGRGWESVTAK